MPSRQPRPPTLWLMTDERVGDALWAALGRLPPGSGVVVRHRATPAGERRALIRRVRRIAAARRLVVTVAGGGAGAGIHGAAAGRGLRTWSAHDRRQAIAGVRAGAAVLFVSPVYATRSHPGAGGLGPAGAARIGSGLPAASVALGGMTAHRFVRLRHWGFHGWAGIDALTRQVQAGEMPSGVRGSNRPPPDQRVTAERLGSALFSLKHRHSR